MDNTVESLKFLMGDLKELLNKELGTNWATKSHDDKAQAVVMRSNYLIPKIILLFPVITHILQYFVVKLNHTKKTINLYFCSFLVDQLEDIIDQPHMKEMLKTTVNQLANDLNEYRRWQKRYLYYIDNYCCSIVSVDNRLECKTIRAQINNLVFSPTHKPKHPNTPDTDGMEMDYGDNTTPPSTSPSTGIESPSKEEEAQNLQQKKVCRRKLFD